MMSAKYGSISDKQILVEKGNEAISEAEVEISDPYRRRWWRSNQNALFGLGHVYNDLCAAMWFSYMMLFFQAVMEMPGTVAGTMLLLGQVVDALATPIVGMLVDKYNTKKCWHLTGSLIVTCTFPLLFLRCWGCRTDIDGNYITMFMPIYYGTLIVLFQIGWAVVQISHLAMIPSISDSLQIRSELTSIRYMGSVISSLMVYFITWIVLKATNYSTFIEPSDDYKFRDVSMIISGIGIASYVLFHLSFKLNQSHSLKSSSHAASNGVEKASLVGAVEESKVFGKSKIIHFLKTPLLYQTSLLYVFSRLYWALSLVYVPLFLEERLLVNPSSGSELIASVPFVLYTSSFFFSLILKSKISSCGNQMAYLIGSFLSLTSSIWIALGVDPQASIVQVYLVAILIGAGSAITLVSSLCVTADLIGPHTHQGAAIYSIVTFADKLVTGVAVITIENYKCDDGKDCPQYYRGVLTYACGGSAILGIICLTITKLTAKTNK